MLADAARARVETASVDLPTGALSVEITGGDWPLDRLCGFAGRNNPKRGFLVVSKVLGRHWPARPSEMRTSARALAARLPPDLPGPVLVMGLAETAICLAQTVHEEMRLATGRSDILFIHSTRQQLDHPVLCRFEEAHSHATAHLIYQPALPDFTQPRSLVLVDDEVSTGATLLELAEALTECWPGVEAICVATLTDWSGNAWLGRMPRPASAVSLLQGRLHWTPTMPAPAPVPATGALGVLAGGANFGRLGLHEPIDTPPSATPPLRATPLRIVGTGEFTYLPFRLAERLEAAGVDVVMQSTSRSPARIGGALRSGLSFADNYATGVPNFLYNAHPADHRISWICHETGDTSVDPALIGALDAKLVGWAA